MKCHKNKVVEKESCKKENYAVKVFKLHTSGTSFQIWEYESQLESLENSLWDRNIRENIENSQNNTLESGSFLEEWVEGFEDILLVKEKERIKRKKCKSEKIERLEFC